MPHSFEIRGLEYTAEVDESIFRSEAVPATGERYEPGTSRLEFVETEPFNGGLRYGIRSGRYTVQNWTDQRDAGLLTDFSGNTWFYDAGEEVTAYYDGENFVAAYNPDIADVWKQLMEGEWMTDFSEEPGLSDTANRLHPGILQRVNRGL